jgi:hypothetical protein
MKTTDPILKVGVSTETQRMEAEALERCDGRKHAHPRHSACSWCLTVVLLGERAMTVEALPPSVGGLSRRIFAILAEDAGAWIPLRGLTDRLNVEYGRGGPGQPPAYTETNVSARIRDLRPHRPVKRKVVKVDGGNVTSYALDLDA